MMQTIALVGNGTYFDCGKLLRQYASVIALDGGYQFCKKNNVVPTRTLGDGDSIDQPPADFIQLTDQTTTDLQKGLQYIAQHYSEHAIDLFGFVSIDRLDHTLSAIHLCTTHPAIRSLYTAYQRLDVLRQEQALAVTSDFSLVPFTPNAQVDITGAEWSGQFTLDTNYSGLSNCVRQADTHITVLHGSVLVIQPWTAT